MVACGGRRRARSEETRSARLSVLASLLCAAVLEASAAVKCGNGVREEGEQCEDGNVFPGDGCSALCECEDDPCAFTVGSAVNLASVVSALRPGPPFASWRLRLCVWYLVSCL